MDISNNEYNTILKPLLEHKHVISMKKYIQHGTVTTYEHCVDVTLTCCKLNQKLHINANAEKLITASMLHDFYLYDWHNNPDVKLHGFSHSTTAAENAKKYFNVDTKVYNAIKTHMWPLNITMVPSSREAWILCISDKYCAFKETLFKRKRKKYD